MSYKGIQIDIRLAQTLPQQIAQWLSLHTQGEGTFQPINQLMRRGSTVFKNWEGASFRLVEDHPEFGTFWHLKTTGSTEDLSMEHLTFFLHEIQPWSIMREEEIIARVVGEDQTSYEKIFWHDRESTLVTVQNGQRYPMEVNHPKNAEVWDLVEGLKFRKDYPENGGWRRYYYPTNAVVSPKQEEKRILARVHNERREQDKAAELQKQIDALEGK